MEENSLPPGFRFHPTDEELITCYLSRKVIDYSFTSKAIAVADLNKCEPWDLPGKAASMTGKVWYFFSLRDRKYPTGLRTNRATEAGYWKTTGKDKEIFRDGVLVGMKKTLVFYKGRAPKGEKTNWVMHEYRLETRHSYKPMKEEWVVCRVFQKNSTGKRPQPPPAPSTSIGGSPSEDLIKTNVPSEVGDMELMPANLKNIVNSPSGNYPEDCSLAYTMNNNMNWGTEREPSAVGSSTLPPLPYCSPSSSTFPTPNTPFNSLLIKALQLKNTYHLPGDYYSSPLVQPQGIIDQNISSFPPALDHNLAQEQQQQAAQPFTTDSIMWWQ